MSMVNLLLKFVSISRAAGLRVSTSEVLDCLDQLKLVDILDDPQFAAVLRANFAKSRREQFHFDRLYNLFFHELRQESNIAHADPLYCCFKLLKSRLDERPGFLGSLEILPIIFLAIDAPILGLHKYFQCLMSKIEKISGCLMSVVVLLEWQLLQTAKLFKLLDKPIRIHGLAQ